MSSFTAEVKGLTAASGAKTTETLAEDLSLWLNDPISAQTTGQSARDFLAARPAAAPALAAAILDILP
jgi:hypothetical protein